MELEENSYNSYNIIPKLRDDFEEVANQIIKEYGEHQDNPNSLDITPSSQCIGSNQCLEMHSYFYFLFGEFLQWCIIMTALYLIILLVYYIFYKCKKDQNPLKHAFKRTWLLGIIIIILIPIILVFLGECHFIDNPYYFYYLIFSR